MFITLDHTELLAILEGAAYKNVAENACSVELENAEKFGEYNLGYIDGTVDLCENLKANVKKYVKEKEEQQKAAEAKREDEKKAADPAIPETKTRSKGNQTKTSKYDN